MFGKKEEKVDLDFQNKKNQIEQGTTIRGDIETKGNIRIDGHVVGNIYSSAKVVIGPDCEIEGDVKSINAEIEGTITGALFVEELLTLKDSAVINGNITAGKVHMFPGAVLNGQVKMNANGNTSSKPLAPAPEKKKIEVAEKAV